MQIFLLPVHDSRESHWLVLVLHQCAPLMMDINVSEWWNQTSKVRWIRESSDSICFYLSAQPPTNQWSTVLFYLQSYICPHPWPLPRRHYDNVQEEDEQQQVLTNVKSSHFCAILAKLDWQLSELSRWAELQRGGIVRIATLLRILMSSTYNQYLAFLATVTYCI